MSAFLAIVKLTCRSAVRSHVFQFLLVLLLLGVLLIPNTIKGDGSAFGFIQVSLKYSLSYVFTILMLSGIWIGCQTMTSDMEDSKLQLITVKPVSRITVWFGKLTGVMAILTVLLFISAAVVYGFITWQYSRAGLIDEDAKQVAASGEHNNRNQEQERIRNELLTGRRRYAPEKPDATKLIARMYEQKMAETNPDGKKRVNVANAEQQDLILKEIQRQVYAGLSEVAPGSTRLWYYKGLPKDVKGSAFVRYRLYLPDSGSQTAKMTLGAWGAVVYWVSEPDPSEVAPGETPKPKVSSAFVSREPEQILADSVNELELYAESFIYDGEAAIGYTNFSQKGPVNFQASDGPFLLIRQTGFLDNYFRAVMMLWLGLFMITLVSVSAASVLSMPVAIFFAICYLAYGSFSLYLQGLRAEYPVFSSMPFTEAFGYVMSQIMLFSVVPLQKFSISDMVANGLLIEYSTMAFTLIFDVILKGGPLALIGIWVYNRRELALASTKH